MVPLEKSFGEFPEFLQVGGLSKIFTILEHDLPITRFSQENRNRYSNQTGPNILYQIWQQYF